MFFQIAIDTTITINITVGFQVGESGFGEFELQGFIHSLTSMWSSRAALVRSQRTVLIGMVMSVD